MQIGIGHNGGPALDSASPGAVTVKLGEKFLQLFQPAQHKAFYGGRGSAKSHAIATYLVIVASNSTQRIVCARQFQNSINDSVKELIENKIKALGLLEQFTITEREIVHRGTGSRFTFVGLDRNPHSIKSLEGADICWVEEASTINNRSMEILIPTIRKPGSSIIWSWNPDHETDPVDQFFRGTNNPKWIRPADSIIQRVGIEDNPWFYSTSMPNQMWQMMVGNFNRYRHIWLGEYDHDYEGKVFPSVVIGSMEVPEYAAPRYGMDFGFGSDPSCVVKVYVMHDTRTVYIAREYYGHVTLAQLPAGIKSVIADTDDLIRADSSQPGTIEHLNGQGFNIVGAKKGPGSVKSGITWLQGFRILIDPSCEFMREEARLYSWQKDKLSGKRLSVPVDAHNHLWDAVRYATESAQAESEDDDEDSGSLLVRF